MAKSISFNLLCNKLGFVNLPGIDPIPRNLSRCVVLNHELVLSLKDTMRATLPYYGLSELPWRIMEIDEYTGTVTATFIREC